MTPLTKADKQLIKFAIDEAIENYTERIQNIGKDRICKGLVPALKKEIARLNKLYEKINE